MDACLSRKEELDELTVYGYLEQICSEIIWVLINYDFLKHELVKIVTGYI